MQIPGNCLHIIAQYPPVMGGAETYCANLSEGLTNLGYSVNTYTSRLKSIHTWRNELPRRDTINGVAVTRFSALKRGRITWRLFHYCRKKYSIRPIFAYELGLMLAEGPICPGLSLQLLLSARQFEVAHIFGLYASLAAQAFATARKVGIPIVITPFVHTGADITLRRLWQKDLLTEAEHVIAMTGSEKSFLVEQIGLRPERVSVISPTIQIDKYPYLEKYAARNHLGLAGESFVVLFIGRQEEYKGLNILIDAWQTLSGRGRNLQVVLVGPKTPYSSDLLARVTSDAIAGIVNLGEVEDATKVMALNACDCLVLPSRGESFGIVLLEAWAAAKPVVATRLESTAAVISEAEDGLLIEIGSAESLVAALTTLMDDPDLASRMGRRGRDKLLLHYTPTAAAAQVEQLYASLARRRRDSA